MRIAEVVGVELWGSAGREFGDYAYTVLYKFNGSIWRGREHAKDELDAWAKFQARLDKEGAPINGYGKSTAQAEES